MGGAARATNKSRGAAAEPTGSASGADRRGGAARATNEDVQMIGPRADGSVMDPDRTPAIPPGVLAGVASRVSEMEQLLEAFERQRLRSVGQSRVWLGMHLDDESVRAGCRGGERHRLHQVAVTGAMAKKLNWTLQTAPHFRSTSKIIFLESQLPGAACDRWSSGGPQH